MTVRANTLVALGAAVTLLVGGGLAFRAGYFGATVDSTHIEVPPAPPEQAPPKPVAASPVERSVNLPYYVVRQSGADPVLVREETSLRVTGSASIWRQGRTALNALAGFPRLRSGVQNPLPQGTRILGLHIALDGIATVDLSPEFRDNFNGGAREEQVTIYALVNTVGSIKGVSGVRFSINGTPIEEFAGHLDLSVPLTPDMSLLEPAS